LQGEGFEVQREMIGIDNALEAMDFVKQEDDVEYVENTEAPGFTEQIKQILVQSNMPLLPTQIRDALLTAGHKGSSLKNMLISVHAVLRRLEPFLEEAQIDGRRAYRWAKIGRAFASESPNRYGHLYHALSATPTEPAPPGAKITGLAAALKAKEKS